MVLAFASRSIRSFAMPSALGNVFRVITKMQERVERRIRHYPNVAAAAAFTAGWTAAGDKLLPSKRGDAISSMATLNPNFCAINEHSINI
jgi:hypothetical protein